MVSSFFRDLLAPRVLESIPTLIVHVVLAVVLTFLVRYVAAWFLSLTRQYHGSDHVWTGQEVIYDTRAWAGLLTVLLWTCVVTYCVWEGTYERLRALIPYGAALLVAIVFTGVSLVRLNRPVKRYREYVRR